MEIHRLGRRVTGSVHRHSGLRGHIEQIVRKLVGAGQNNAGNLETHQILEGSPAVVIIKMIEKTGLGVAENLNALVREQVRESRENKTGTVEFAFGNPAFLLVNPVQPAELDIVVPADVIKKIGDRYRSLFQAFLVEIHGTVRKKWERSAGESGRDSPAARLFYRIFSLCLRSWRESDATQVSIAGS